MLLGKEVVLGGIVVSWERGGIGERGGIRWNSCIMGKGCYWGKEAVFCGIVVSWERGGIGERRRFFVE